jgi:hypothetical protein
MKSVLALATFVSAFSISAMAAKSYQVTGPVLEVTDTKIVIQKGKEKWELSRAADTKVTGDLKVGSNATVWYSMHADEVEVKAEKAKKK